MYAPGTVILPLLWSLQNLDFNSVHVLTLALNLRVRGKIVKIIQVWVLPCHEPTSSWKVIDLFGGVCEGLAIGAWFQFSFCFEQLLIQPIPIIFLYTLVVPQFNKTKLGTVPRSQHNLPPLARTSLPCQERPLNSDTLQELLAKSEKRNFSFNYRNVFRLCLFLQAIHLGFSTMAFFFLVKQ